jgi:hypothetical protein
MPTSYDSVAFHPLSESGVPVSDDRCAGAIDGH